jgi:hypothetical protein
MQSSQQEIVKLKTDNEVLQISVDHLKYELDQKSALIRRQNLEIEKLRESVLHLQRNSK